MKKNELAHNHHWKSVGALKTKVPTAILAGVLWICSATATCLATEWQVGVDQNPQPIGPNAWHFTINLGVKPAGHLEFVGSQYDFAWFTRGVAIDYDFNFGQEGSGCSDPRTFLAIAPALFEPTDGFIHGWDVSDLKDGTFSGVVHATAPLTAVYFFIAADRLVPVAAPDGRSLRTSH